ncbi:GvpL/GvpF family gas vesicle protein [Amycolatopsis sp. SID8362]|uniref:GvpL/GvpF family gas vesicle protein n=1 Tax=Amycolatopsis sp. SID8362 TaxID=2690346 RepID=UPI00136D1058|nr:GvpL/GvpF family gas vesicle protein [Amycolatopsis sp. SID8362]NBH01747.1 gas vesicle protein GvpFL [Amycolatopsis sp. SID8362]NED38448.1 GvpL/GvpF family gas vesicle protein [Amycolatopsis sp. SID8362]
MTEVASETAVYVYGIVPADVETDPDARGVGDPPAAVTTVRGERVAALVSEVSRDEPLGRPEDLTAHAGLLDAAAAEVPVLPVRFGAVLPDENAVAEELLKANEDEFAAALAELEGKAQYVVKARYVEKAVLGEILDENPELARLRDEIRDKPEDVTRDQRIALGEQVGNAITAKRTADTQRMAEALNALGVEISPREPTHEEEAVHLACLAETAKQADLEAAVEELAQDWRGRVEVRLLGPLAAYDFVVTQRPGE